MAKAKSGDNLLGIDETTGDKQDAKLSPIQAFFNGRSVLVTGASGFVGKILVEKLARSCRGLNKVYCLIREKDGKSPEERLNELFEMPIFEQSHHLRSKVVALEGDVLLEGLGLSLEDRRKIIEDVSVVFHVAASVRFDEPLRKAIDINVLATRRVLELCHQLRECAALVHVSTAYCFCNRSFVGEVIYEEKIHYKKVIDASEWMDDETAQKCLTKIMDNRPSTYHYTKALAERLLAEEGRGLPISIIRPSIVTASWKDPVAGWLDNYNGPAGFVIATGKGVLRTMYIRPDSNADIFPVDLVARMMITSAWYCSLPEFSSPFVVNCTSGPIRQISWRQIFDFSRPIVLDNPSMQIYRYPGGSYKESKFWNRIAMFFDHTLPAIILDRLAVMFGHRPILGYVYDKIHRAMHILEYFTTHEWEFSIDNLEKLQSKLEHPEDKQEFNFDIREIDWLPFLENYILGVRKYVLKEDPSTIPAARAKLNRIWWIGTITQLLIVYGSFRLLMKYSTTFNGFVWDITSRLIIWAVQLNLALRSRRNTTLLKE